MQKEVAGLVGRLQIEVVIDTADELVVVGELAVMLALLLDTLDVGRTGGRRSLRVDRSRDRRAECIRAGFRRGRCSVACDVRGGGRARIPIVYKRARGAGLGTESARCANMA